MEIKPKICTTTVGLDKSQTAEGCPTFANVLYFPIASGAMQESCVERGSMLWFGSADTLIRSARLHHASQTQGPAIVKQHVLRSWLQEEVVVLASVDSRLCRPFVILSSCLFGFVFVLFEDVCMFCLVFRRPNTCR